MQPSLTLPVRNDGESSTMEMHPAVVWVIAAQLFLCGGMIVFLLSKFGVKIHRKPFINRKSKKSEDDEKSSAPPGRIAERTRSCKQKNTRLDLDEEEEEEEQRFDNSSHLPVAEVVRINGPTTDNLITRLEENAEHVPVAQIIECRSSLEQSSALRGSKNCTLIDLNDNLTENSSLELT